MARANRKHGRGWTKPAIPENPRQRKLEAEGTVVLARMMGRTVPADLPRLRREPGRTEPSKRSWWRRVFRTDRIGRGSKGRPR